MSKTASLDATTAVTAVTASISTHILIVCAEGLRAGRIRAASLVF